MSFLDLSAASGAELHHSYHAAAPWPHIVIDGAVSVDTARSIAAESERMPPSSLTREWSRRVHKLSCNRLEQLGEVTRSVIDTLQSVTFQSFLEQLSGIDRLIADPTLLRAGLLITPSGGYQVVHEDFPRHPLTSHWNRVIVLLYAGCNAGGGELELWPADMRRRWRIEPKPGRLVIFETGAGTRHSVRPVAAGGSSRVALSVRYYTAEPPPVRPTGPLRRTVPRPGEPFWSILPSRHEIWEYVALGLGRHTRAQ